MKATLDPELVSEAALNQGVCARPVIAKVTDLETARRRWCPSGAAPLAMTVAPPVPSAPASCDCSSAGRAGTSTPSRNGHWPRTTAKRTTATAGGR